MPDAIDNSSSTSPSVVPDRRDAVGISAVFIGMHGTIALIERRGALFDGGAASAMPCRRRRRLDRI